VALMARAPLSASLHGIFCMIAGMALLTLNNAFLKTLTGDYPPGQLVAMRAAFVFIPIGIIAWRSGGIGSLRINNLPGQTLRAALLVLTQFLMVTSIALLPLADVTALTFAGPLVITALAPAILGEHVGWRRWSAVAVGFVGVMVMLRPDPSIFQLASLLPLAAATSGALRDLVTRRISTGDKSIAILGFSTAAVLVCGLLSLFYEHAPLNFADLPVLALTGCLQGAAHFILIEAFRHGEAAVVAPFKYSALPFAVVYGLIMFGHVPDMWIVLGALPVIASGLYILHRERVRRR
jgi:drug/metabolite transporter (DMT)-like permease